MSKVIIQTCGTLAVGILGWFSHTEPSPPIQPDRAAFIQRYHLLDKRCETGLTYEEWKQYNLVTEQLKGKEPQL